VRPIKCNKIVSLHLTDDQLVALECMARIKNLAKSEFLRNILLDFQKEFEEKYGPMVVKRGEE
jgi:hypothetical protein